MMINSPLTYNQQIAICDICPLQLRLAEACPRQPDLFEKFPVMITEDQLYTSEQLTELKELGIPFNTFRESLLLNENM